MSVLEVSLHQKPEKPRTPCPLPPLSKRSVFCCLLSLITLTVKMVVVPVKPLATIAVFVMLPLTWACLLYSPSGCTFWGKKPWSRKKKILWQLGTLIGAPVGISLIAGIAIPAMVIGIPVYVGRKVRHALLCCSSFGFVGNSLRKRKRPYISGLCESQLVCR